MSPKIVAIVLAAGYGTRLEADILKDTGNQFQHLRGLPKALIPVNGKPLIDYWIDEFQRLTDWISDFYVVTNEKFYSLFLNWAKNKGLSESKLLNDGTTCNEDRLGAVTDIQFVIQEKKIMSPILVIAGDTLFHFDFQLLDFLQHYERNGFSNVICHYKLKNHAEVRSRGIVELDAQNKVIKFLEKPKPEETTSDFAATPLYIFSQESLPLIQEFTQTRTRNERDAPGQLVAWLYDKQPFYSLLVSGRHDIGNLSDYITTDQYFRELEAKQKNS
jgi:NDP-sugar pyrophosphorylase family protein